MLPVTWVRSIARGALDHKLYDQLLVTASESPWRNELAMAARATRETLVYVDALDR